MADTATTLQIRRAIKSLLKKQGGTYSDLGKMLGLTVPAVKRFMTKGDLTIGRLEQIAGWFGLSLFEFMHIAKNLEVRPFEFSIAQETVLAKNPRALYVLLLLGAGLPLSEVKRRAQLKDTELRADLFVLDKINAIKLGVGDLVRILARGPYKFVTKGPMQKRFLATYIRQITSLVTLQPPAEDLQLPFELYLSDRLLDQMKQELRAVFEKYRGLSRIEHEISAAQDLKPVSGLILVKPFDSWRKILLGK